MMLIIQFIMKYAKTEPSIINHVLYESEVLRKIFRCKFTFAHLSFPPPTIPPRTPAVLIYRVKES